MQAAEWGIDRSPQLQVTRTGKGATVTPGHQPPHHEVEAATCPYCTALEPLRRAVQELLGDPITEALALVDAEAFKEAFHACAPAERTKLLADLGTPSMRNLRTLPTAAATHALSLLRHADPAFREEACRFLTWPVRSSLLADDAIDQADGPTLTSEQVRDALTRILQHWNQALVRLALVTAWDDPRTRAIPVFLEVALTDERLSLGAWAPHAAELAGQCQQTAARLATLGTGSKDEETDHPDRQYQAGRSDIPTHQQPDQGEPARAEQHQPPTTGSTSPVAGDASVEGDALTRARTALASSHTAAERVMDRLAAQFRPRPADLEALATLSAAFADAAATLLPDHADPSLPELEAAAAAHARDQRQALERITELTGPSPLDQLIADARARATALLAAPTWDPTTTNLATGLSALAELVDLKSDTAVQRVIELDETARRYLPPELIPLVVTAGRGQLHVADSPPASQTPARPAPGEGSQRQREAPDAPPGGEAGATDPAASEPDTANANLAPIITTTEPSILDGSEPAALTTKLAVSAASTAVEQQQHQAPEPTVTDTANKDEDRQAARLTNCLGRLLAERRFGLTYWITTAAGRSDGHRRVMRAAALIDATRQPTGACAAALRGALDGISRKELEGDRPAQVVALVSALRAALVSPYSETASVITDLVEAFGDLPELAEVADAVHQAALRGLVIGTDVLTSVSDLAEVERAVHDTCEAAAAMLTRPRHFTFPRATLAWQRWITPDGLVGALLTPAAHDDRARRAQVAARVVRLRSRGELERAITTIDSQLRSHGSRRLEGSARRNLASAAEEALSVASGWMEAVTALDHHREQASGPTWQHKLLDQLRTTVHERHQAILTQLDALTDGGPAERVGAARAAIASLRETFALLDGEPLPGFEWPPALAVNRELVKVAGLRLDTDLEPHGDLDVDALLDAVDRDWIDAFNDRSAAGDHVGTKHMLAILHQVAPIEVATLTQRRHAELTAGQQRAAERGKQLEVRLDRARRQGFLLEDDWRDLTVRLLATRPQRDDLDQVTEELDQISIDFDHARSAARARFETLLDQLRTTSKEVAARAADLQRLVEAGDLATAEEALVLIAAGEEPPVAPGTRHDLRAFFPAVPAALGEELSDTVIQTAASGGRFGPLEFSKLSTAQREAAARGLRAWQHATGVRVAQWLPELAPALRLAGVEADSARRSPIQGASDRVWVDLGGVRRTGKSLVSAFGSASGSELRLLLCWGNPSATTLLEWIAHDPSQRPVVVCHFGVMAPERRRDLLATIRSRRTRPVVVVDDAVMAYLAARGVNRFDVTMRLTLPFSAVNPFMPFAAGDVPVEMFYGRSSERSSIMDPLGTSLIYGGRQLGKSALLKAAARHFEEVAHYRALYVDLRPAAIGATQRPDALWTLLWERLGDAGIAQPRRGGRRGDTAGAVTEAVRQWLDADTGRRLLLLLDECDDFFDADATAHFNNTTRLRELMDITQRRCKPVFAGLHQVQRFSGIPNQPLAHLGQPLPIGPLRPQAAFDLIHLPLTALGYHIPDDLVARILAYCNYGPLNLQLFGHALVNELLSRRGSDELTPPLIVTEADVEAVAESRPLQDEIRNRFELTLRLDPRYRVIAYVVAWRRHESGVDAALPAYTLREECTRWWPAGFAQLGTDEFRALLEEMVGLGVLAMAPTGGYHMRSPNVLRMLGTIEQVEDTLLSAETLPPPSGFVAAQTRRVLNPKTGMRSPLSEAQLAELVVERRNQVRVVLGTAATGVERVVAALSVAAEGIGVGSTVFTASKRRQFEEALRAGKPGEHRVIVSDLREVNLDQCAASLAKADTSLPPAGTTRSVILIAGSENLPWWPAVLERTTGGLGVVELRRHSPRSLWAWAVDEERAFQDDRSRDELLRATGGWPYLIDRVVDLSRNGLGPNEILDQLAEHLATDEGAAELLGAIGLNADSGLADLWDLAVDLLDEPIASDDLVDLAASSQSSPGASIATLRALQLFNVDTEGRLTPEPTVADAWRRRQS